MKEISSVYFPWGQLSVVIMAWDHGLTCQQDLYNTHVNTVSQSSNFVCFNKIRKSALFPHAKIGGCISSDNLMNEIAMASYQMGTRYKKLMR